MIDPVRTRTLRLAAPKDFDYERVVFSHGWLRLPPFHLDGDTLKRWEAMPGAEPAVVRMGYSDGEVLLTTTAPPGAHPLIVDRTRRIFSLDLDLTGWEEFCRGHPELSHLAGAGAGRMLRGASVWEDLLKTIFSTNTTWRQTVAMTARLVETFGDGGLAFPGPEQIARLTSEELAAVCRCGYRAASVVEIARRVVAGEADLTAMESEGLSDCELELRLRALPGIGPYAAAHMMMLLGRWDHLPVDSWFRRVVRAAWFPGLEPTEREMIGAFERFRPYRSLVYQFWDWDDRATQAAIRGEPDGDGPRV